MMAVSNAMRMADGEVVFRDFFQLVPPGAELVYKFLFSIFGVRIWVLNATILMLAFSLVALILYLSRKLITGSVSFLPAIIFLVLGFRQFSIDGSERLFSIVLVLSAIAAIMSGRSLRHLAIAGCLCGLASFFVHPRGVLGIGSICAFFLIRNFQNGLKVKPLAKSVATVVGTFIGTVLITQSYFIWHAGAETYYFSLIGFLQKNYASDPLNNMSAFMSDVPSLADSMMSGSLLSGILGYVRGPLVAILYYSLLPFTYIVAFVYLWRRKLSIFTKSPLSNLLLLWLVGVFLAIGVSAPTAVRLFHVSAPALIILVWLCQQYSPIRRLLPVAGILLALLGGSYVLQRQLTAKYFLETPAGTTAFFYQPTFEKYSWIGSQTRPGEFIYEARHPNFYFPFYLRNPTSMYLIRDSEYTPQFQVDSVVKALEEKRPRLIIWPSNWSKPLESRAPDDHLDPLWQFVKDNYSIKHVFARYDNQTRSDNGGDSEVWELQR